jgi:futalosine hydrolase
MDLLIVSATPFEIDPLKKYLDNQFIPFGNYRYQKGALTVSLLITGVGLPLAAYSLGRLFGQKRYDLAINAGVAGAFDRDLKTGEVVQVVTERFGDLGVEEADGRFTDIHQLGLIEADQAPFTGGRLVNEASLKFDFLPKVHGLSVNKVHGFPESITQIREKYDVQVESMEGAAFFYACLQEHIPFLELRAISNYVEARNRENWDVWLAIQQLNEVLSQIVKMFI